jgi:hypothetical protein
MNFQLAANNVIPYSLGQSLKAKLTERYVRQLL